tara:strand:- start:1195 stop:1305 length:111 start_codon:yes stop_codon:yes gene_type:complete
MYTDNMFNFLKFFQVLAAVTASLSYDFKKFLTASAA